MHDTDISAYLALHRTPSLTDKSFCRLLQAVSQVGDIFKLSSAQLSQLQIPLATQELLHCSPDSKQLACDLQALEHHQIQLVPYLSPHYPELLKQINDPPPLPRKSMMIPSTFCSLSLSISFFTSCDKLL